MSSIKYLVFSRYILFLFFNFISDLIKSSYCFLLIYEFSNRLFITRFLLYFANFGFLYGLYLLGAFGNAANKDASE